MFSYQKPDSANITSTPTNNHKFKLDAWKKMPEYIVEQETDTSIASNSHDFHSSPHQYQDYNSSNSIWIKNELAPAATSTLTSSSKPSRNSKKNVEFEIEVEKPSSSAINFNSHLNRSSAGFDRRHPASSNLAQVYSSKDGRICIENVGGYPGANEIIIQSDVFNYRNSCDPYASYASGVSGTHMCGGVEMCPEAMATRMSSGYFSGDEFRSYYNSSTNTTNYTNYFQQVNSNNSPTMDQSHSPCGIHNETTSSATQFNINKFLNNNSSNRAKYKSDDALEEFNKMYKSLRLEDDDALLDRANARDYPMYGKINQLINSDLDVTLQLSNNSNSSSNVGVSGGAKYRSKSVYDEISDYNTGMGNTTLKNSNILRNLNPPIIWAFLSNVFFVFNTF